ncbi:hypothetical protein [Mucilaginibacter sp.]|uniref:hypothetical protein n=1 Tax=Mucilaginibacter sp. TaxID=1882438 RepID=UPI002845F47F|nr:hypothetical protein [Mucilaginibacter sp.]MDR3697445.1 hypothetical protein [Mucilaginibacter sp.]
MKKIIFTAVIAISCLSIKFADAQVSIGVGLNISSQPDWGPTGYDNAGYYYIPDIGAYYDVNAHEYIYMENNTWVHRGYLPQRYRNYDLYSGYKVVINDRDPWLRDNDYRGRYASYRGRHDQAMIRNSHDARYRNHWMGGGNNDRMHGRNTQGHSKNMRNGNMNRNDHNMNQKMHNQKQGGRQNDHGDQQKNKH